MKTITKRAINHLTYDIIGAGIDVHRHLGPGLLEGVYEKALIHELTIRGLKLEFEQPVNVEYKGITLDCNLRFDILVEQLIMVELKAVENFHPVFGAQLLTYMLHRKAPKGILMNFGVQNLYKEGIRTFVNHLFSDLPE
jgi:GxxExxY protein